MSSPEKVFGDLQSAVEGLRRAMEANTKELRRLRAEFQKLAATAPAVPAQSHPIASVLDYVLRHGRSARPRG